MHTLTECLSLCGRAGMLQPSSHNCVIPGHTDALSECLGCENPIPFHRRGNKVLKGRCLSPNTHCLGEMAILPYIQQEPNKCTAGLEVLAQPWVPRHCYEGNHVFYNSLMFLAHPRQNCASPSLMDFFLGSLILCLHRTPHGSITVSPSDKGTEQGWGTERAQETSGSL